jgi:hypothetical protein
LLSDAEPCGTPLRSSLVFKEHGMTRSSDPGGVPHSSGRNRFATKKTLTLILVVVGFLLVAVMVPW